MAKAKWWVGWYGCEATIGDFKLYSPCWETCETYDEPPRQLLCAAIWAEGEGEIKEIIYGCYDKRPNDGEIEFRFMQLMSDDWDPRKIQNGRFKFTAWMEPYWQRGEYRQEASFDC